MFANSSLSFAIFPSARAELICCRRIMATGFTREQPITSLNLIPPCSRHLQPVCSHPYHQLFLYEKRYIFILKRIIFSILELNGKPRVAYVRNSVAILLQARLEMCIWLFIKLIFLKFVGFIYPTTPFVVSRNSEFCVWLPR